jgi:hypothetical protein
MARQRVTETTQTSKVQTPTEDDFSAAAVQRWVFWETVQHPATTLSAAGAVVAGLANGLFGVSPTGLGIALGCVFVSGAAWIYNFFIRGEDLAKGRVESLLKQSAEGEVRELADLARRCQQVKFADGSKEASDILSAYRRLKEYLDAHDHADDNASIQRLRSLARDTFREGVTLSKKALATWNAVAAVDTGQLERELKLWDKQLSQNKLGDEERASREQQIDSHRRRLESVQSRRGELAELLAQLDALEGALERAYLESVQVIEQDPAALGREGSAATQLERAVAAARRVEDRLRDTGPKDDGSDAVYYEAGKRIENSDQ